MLQHFSCVSTSGKSSTFVKETCQVSTGAQHLYTLDLIWIYMGLFIIRIPIDYPQHSWFSQVVDIFLYGGPPAWVHYWIIFQRVCFPHTWQELPPEAKSLSSSWCPSQWETEITTGQGSQFPSYITTQHDTISCSISAQGLLWVFSSTVYIYSRTLNLWLFFYHQASTRI